MGFAKWIYGTGLTQRTGINTGASATTSPPEGEDANKSRRSCRAADPIPVFETPALKL